MNKLTGKSPGNRRSNSKLKRVRGAVTRNRRPQVKDVFTSLKEDVQDTVESVEHAVQKVVDKVKSALGGIK